MEYHSSSPASSTRKTLINLKQVSGGQEGLPKVVVYVTEEKVMEMDLFIHRRKVLQAPKTFSSCLYDAVAKNLETGICS